MGAIGSVAAFVPLQPFMFGLCNRGRLTLWGGERRLACGKTYAALPSLGRSRI
jgi:hypothetical protein